MAQRIFKLVGVAYGVYEGNKWGQLHLIQPVYGDNSLGWRPVKKEDSKADYDLCVEIARDWDMYEDQKIYCGCQLGGRIDRVELAD